MKQKLDLIREAWARGDHAEALRVASKFFDRSAETQVFKRGHQAMVHPGFYAQLGKDPKALVAEAIAALDAKFALEANPTGAKTMDTTLSTTQICDLISQLTGKPCMRPNSKDAAVARFLKALAEKIGEDRAAYDAPRILAAGGHSAAVLIMEKAVDEGAAYDAHIEAEAALQAAEAPGALAGDCPTAADVPAASGIVVKEYEIPAFLLKDASAKAASIEIADLHASEHPTAKANAASWDQVTKGGKAKRAAKEAAPKAPKAEKPAKAPKASATEKAIGKRKGLLEAAARGDMPAAPDFSAETHKRFRAKLAEVEALAAKGDIAALKAFPINPVSSSPKSIDRYRNLAVAALEARAAQAKAA